MRSQQAYICMGCFVDCSLFIGLSLLFSSGCDKGSCSVDEVRKRVGRGGGGVKHDGLCSLFFLGNIHIYEEICIMIKTVSWVQGRRTHL